MHADFYFFIRSPIHHQAHITGTGGADNKINSGAHHDGGNLLAILGHSEGYINAVVLAVQRASHY